MAAQPAEVAAVDEPVGRFGAAHTINRGLQEAPVLRQGLGLTWSLAAVGATGRVVVPILLQQAIDKGINGADGVDLRFVAMLAAIGVVALFIASLAQRTAAMAESMATKSTRTSPSALMPLSIACWSRIGTTTRPVAPTAARLHVSPRP